MTLTMTLGANIHGCIVYLWMSMPDAEWFSRREVDVCLIMSQDHIPCAKLPLLAGVSDHDAVMFTIGEVVSPPPECLPKRVWLPGDPPAAPNLEGVPVDMVELMRVWKQWWDAYKLDGSVVKILTRRGDSGRSAPWVTNAVRRTMVKELKKP